MLAKWRHAWRSQLYIVFCINKRAPRAVLDVSMLTKWSLECRGRAVIQKAETHSCTGNIWHPSCRDKLMDCQPFPSCRLRILRASGIQGNMCFHPEQRLSTVTAILMELICHLPPKSGGRWAFWCPELKVTSFINHSPAGLLQRSPFLFLLWLGGVDVIVASSGLRTLGRWHKKGGRNEFFRVSIFLMSVCIFNV